MERYEMAELLSKKANVTLEEARQALANWLVLLLFAALAAWMPAFAAMAVAVFCPENFGLWAPLAFFLKLGALLFVSVSLPRAAMARLRIRNVASFYFTALGATALFGALLVVLDAFLAGGAA